jgi:hypothetical protein
MKDVRENVLARLLELVADIPSIRSTQRNNVDITELQLPAALLFDGDEETDGAAELAKPSDRPYPHTRMTPTISIVQQADAVGSEMTAFRSQLVKLVLNDTELNEQIVKTGRFGNGAIRYLGCSTNFGWGRFMHGVVDVNFLFKYSLKIEEL